MLYSCPMCPWSLRGGVALTQTLAFEQDASLSQEVHTHTNKSSQFGEMRNLTDYSKNRRKRSKYVFRNPQQTTKGRAYPQRAKRKGIEARKKNNRSKAGHAVFSAETGERQRGGFQTAFRVSVIFLKIGINEKHGKGFVANINTLERREESTTTIIPYHRSGTF